LERPEQAVGLVGLTSFDAARLMQDLEQGLPLPQIGAPFQTPFDVLERDRLAAEESRGIPETVTAAPRMDTTLQPAYQAILERMAEQYARAQQRGELGAEPGAELDPRTLRDFEAEYRFLREHLMQDQFSP